MNLQALAFVPTNSDKLNLTKSFVDFKPSQESIDVRQYSTVPVQKTSNQPLEAQSDSQNPQVQNMDKVKLSLSSAPFNSSPRHSNSGVEFKPGEP